MSAAQKDTVYIDIDDEITSVIDKVVGSSQKIVAVVLPKRASVLQSIVHMKLLKRAADDANKNLVLVTSEAGLLPLAGVAGVHVAKTLESKPYVPTLPTTSDAPELVITEAPDELQADTALNKTRSVGELAGLAPLEAIEDEAIEVDNSDPPDVATPLVAGKKAKKFKIPNFERFRTRLILGVAALVLLIAGWVVANIVLPKAVITIKTDTTSITSTFDFTASAAAKELNLAKKVLPAELKEIKKTDVEKVPTTGQKDVGEKATGTVKLYNCSKDDKLADVTRTVAAGTGISTGNTTYILSKNVDVEPSSFTGNTCQKNKPSASVAVTAQASGDQYNADARQYSVANFPTMSGEGSTMAGGTTKIIKIVGDQDVAMATQKLSAKPHDEATEQVKQDLKTAGLYGITETFTAAAPALSASPAVGTEANEVSVTAVMTYSMLGVKEADLNKVLEAEVNKQIDSAKQVILDGGLSKAIFKVLDKKVPSELQISLQTVSTVGANLDAESLKREVAGKKRGPTQSSIQNRPGVRGVTVEYSPFWVYGTPKKTSKILINIEQISQ